MFQQGPGLYFKIQNLAIPTINPQEVLVELEVTGFCGTDISLAHGYLGPCQPILGHEGVGRIVAAGSMCTSEAAVVGRLVGVGWIRDACGSCRVCGKDMRDETRCLRQVFSGRDGYRVPWLSIPLYRRGISHLCPMTYLPRC